MVACSGIPTDIHPTLNHPIKSCLITCANGRHFGYRDQHLCQGDRHFLEIDITGEDNVPEDPSESRWYTGLTSTGADYEVKRRLEDEGLKTGTVEWGRRYSVVLKDVQREMGNEARAAYKKQDVVLMPCKAYIAMYCDQPDKKCGTHPGEDISGNPTGRDH